MRILSLQITQKDLQLSFFLFHSFSLKFSAGVPSVFAVNMCDQYRTYLVDTLVTSDVYVLKFQVWEDGMPCALEINSNGGFKRQNMESSSVALKNLYIQYHNAYGDQTWQSGDLSWGVSIRKALWPSDNEVLQET